MDGKASPKYLINAKILLPRAAPKGGRLWAEDKNTTDAAVT